MDCFAFQGRMVHRIVAQDGVAATALNHEWTDHFLFGGHSV
jgi:hypothetical protein